MNKFFWTAILGGAMLMAMPASASTTTFNFLNCGDTGNPACNSDVSSYSVTNTLGSSNVTATATAFFVTGTSSGPTTSADFAAGQVGSYSGAGLGICETNVNTNGDDCASPDHQINNGADTTLSGGNGSGTDYYEFMLIQFSAAVDLSQITLGNYGSTSTSGTNNPFSSTYYTSTSSSSLTAMETALEATTLSSMTGTGFGTTGSQEGCTTGSTTSTLTSNSACAINDTGINENLNGTGVTYLLIGASTTTNLNYDFFKIQDLSVSSYQAPGTPEPATFALFGLALTGLGIYGRKRKSSN